MSETMSDQIDNFRSGIEFFQKDLKKLEVQVQANIELFQIVVNSEGRPVNWSKLRLKLDKEYTEAMTK